MYLAAEIGHCKQSMKVLFFHFSNDPDKNLNLRLFLESNKILKNVPPNIYRIKKNILKQPGRVWQLASKKA